MKIRLKEREEAILSTLPITTTFKIPESSFVFMKVDVDGLTVRPKKRPPQPGLPVEQEEPKPIKVLIPEEKTTVVCVSTGKVQFLSIYENVQIVELECVEIAKEKKIRECKNIKLGDVDVRRSDDSSS